MPFVWPIDGIGQSMYGPTMTFGWSIDVIGIAGTTLCWLPQALKVIREKETRALSLPATAAFTAGVLSLARLWSCHRRLAADRLKRGDICADVANSRDEAQVRLSRRSLRS